MKKKNLVLITTVMLVALLVVGGTMAWFTAEADPVTNKFEAGTLIMSVHECFNACDAQNVNPGDCIKKQVKFKNDGTKRMFVRVKLEPEFKNQAGEVISADGIIDYDINPLWKYHDGYYYYPKEVAPKAFTPLIIKQICFDGQNMNDDYQGSKFTLTVISEAIQVTHGAALDEWGVDPAGL